MHVRMYVGSYKMTSNSTAFAQWMAGHFKQRPLRTHASYWIAHQPATRESFSSTHKSHSFQHYTPPLVLEAHPEWNVTKLNIVYTQNTLTLMEYAPGWREKQKWPCSFVVVDATGTSEDASVAVTFLPAAWGRAVNSAHVASQHCMNCKVYVCTYCE